MDSHNSASPANKPIAASHVDLHASTASAMRSLNTFYEANTDAEIPLDDLEVKSFLLFAAVTWAIGTFLSRIQLSCIANTNSQLPTW